MTTPTDTTPDVKAIKALRGSYERSLNTADAELEQPMHAGDPMSRDLQRPAIVAEGLAKTYPGPDGGVVAVDRMRALASRLRWRS
jgi:hypothetical protein